MKYKIRAVADLHSALRDLEHQVRDPRHLRVGRDYASFQMRPREFLGNWLMCVVLCHATGRRWTLSADPLGGDGAILDRDENTGFLTEHVFVPPPRGSAELDVEDQLLDAVRAKAAKGAEYARGKTLVVFSEAHGVWKPTRVGEAIADLHGFDAVWAIALEGVENGAYVCGRRDALPGLLLVNGLIDSIRRSVALCHTVTGADTFAVDFRMIVSKGQKIAFFNDWQRGHKPTDREGLYFDRLVVTHEQFSVEPPAAVVRLLLDQVWQAFGYVNCGYFDEGGSYKPPA